MPSITYTQLTKDNAYWPEKPNPKNDLAGHTCALITLQNESDVILNLLIDAGLGCINALGNPALAFDWNAPLHILITHGHPDHHLELQMLSELHCKRMTAERKTPAPVYGTQTTYEKWLKPVHDYGFNPTGGNTLTFKSINPVKPCQLNPPPLILNDLKIYAIDNDHFPGAVIYVIQAADIKFLIAWDMRTLPDPDCFPIMQHPTIALVEANTLVPSATSGHTSADELILTGFLNTLQVKDKIYLVHFGGRLDETNPATCADDAFLATIQNNYPENPLLDNIEMIHPNQQFTFNIDF